MCSHRKAKASITLHLALPRLRLIQSRWRVKDQIKLCNLCSFRAAIAVAAPGVSGDGRKVDFGAPHGVRKINPITMQF
jgi:hypothetical protein